MDDACRLYDQSIAIYEKVLGHEHPDVATLLNNRADVFRQQVSDSWLLGKLHSQWFSAAETAELLPLLPGCEIAAGRKWGELVLTAGNENFPPV